MVSVFEGQLSRTWYFNNKGRNHVISLYHDTITGLRSAMLDFVEIRGSSGNSSLMMESKGHRIFFSVDSLPGFIEIKRSGWTGFAYSCIIDNVRLPEATEVVADDQSEVFRVKVTGTTSTPDENSDNLVTWYVVEATRMKDGVTTEVHRRFRDFAELNSQIKQNFKGHHLRDTLPPLPEKPLKTLTDHRDPGFIQDRQLKLDVYLRALIAVPHVSHMICVKAFVGLMDGVREYSVSFHVPQLGLSLLPLANGSHDPEATVVVGSIVKPEVCLGVKAGDTISKINGVPVSVSGVTFQGIVNRIKVLPRPMIVHFISVIGGEEVVRGEGVRGGEDEVQSGEQSHSQQSAQSAAQSVASPASSLPAPAPFPAPATPATTAAPPATAVESSSSSSLLWRDDVPQTAQSAPFEVPVRPAVSSTTAPSTAASQPVLKPATQAKYRDLFGEDDLGVTAVQSAVQSVSVSGTAAQSAPAPAPLTTASTITPAAPVQEEEQQPVVAPASSVQSVQSAQVHAPVQSSASAPLTPPPVDSSIDPFFDDPIAPASPLPAPVVATTAEEQTNNTTAVPASPSVALPPAPLGWD